MPQAPTDTDTPNSATKMAIGSGNQFSNHTQPTEDLGADYELAADHNSDVTSATSSGANDNGSYYVELHRNTPSRSDNSLEPKTIIEEIVQMHDDVNTVFKYFYTPRALFTHPHKINPIELTGKDITSNQTPQDNGIMLPILT